jgi:hypothetical protein
VSEIRGAKYLDGGDGKWGCLGCGYSLYPDGGKDGYCANVHCLLRHPHAANADNVIRLVKRIAALEARLASAERCVRAVKDDPHMKNVYVHQAVGDHLGKYPDSGRETE